MKPTQADVAYWQARHLPRWAQDAETQRTRKRALHAAVNSHAKILPRSAELETHNALALLRGARLRGAETLLSFMQSRYMNLPQVQPKRAALYRRWIFRMKGWRTGMARPEL